MCKKINCHKTTYRGGYCYEDYIEIIANNKTLEDYEVFEVNKNV